MGDTKQCATAGCSHHVGNPLLTDYCYQCRRHREVPRCACGELIRALGHDKCFDCRYPRVVSRGCSAFRHVSQSVYVKHDPIAARYAWKIAVSR